MTVLCFSFQEKYEKTKSKLLTAKEEGQNKKELEEALSALSVEESELKKKEEEIKNKEKVLYSSYEYFRFKFFHNEYTFN